MEKKLYRESNDKVIGGVAAGLARYFEIDVTWMRIFFILAAIFGFSGVLIYVILWIAIPEKPFNWSGNATDYRVKDEKAGEAQPEPASPKAEAEGGRAGRIGGFILIFMGLFFLMKEFDLVPYWFSLHKLWPLVFLIPGLVMLANSGKNGVKQPKPAKKSKKKSTAQPADEDSPAAE